MTSAQEAIDQFTGANLVAAWSPWIKPCYADHHCGLGNLRAAQGAIKGATMEERTGPYALPKCTGDTRGSVAPGGANVPYYETCTRASTRGTSGYQPLCC